MTGIRWVHLGIQREKDPQSGHAREASWRMPPWRCAVREQLALAIRVGVWGGVPAREVARAYAQTSR